MEDVCGARYSSPYRGGLAVKISARSERKTQAELNLPWFSRIVVQQVFAKRGRRRTLIDYLQEVAIRRRVESACRRHGTGAVVGDLAARVLNVVEVEQVENVEHQRQLLLLRETEIFLHVQV